MAHTESSFPTLFRTPAASVGIDPASRVVWLRGEHDIATVAELSATLARAICLDDADVVADLSGLEFLDASTIGVLVRARFLLQLRSRSLALRYPSPWVRRILDLCRLGGLVDLGGDDLAPPGAAGALGSWVAVPADHRQGAPADRLWAPLAERVRT